MESWKQITSEQDVLSIIKKSSEKPQIIFKDSLSCGISAYAKQRLQQGNDLIIDKVDFNQLDLLRYRSVSNFIATTLDVIHQSPQIIVIKDGKAVHTVTHHSIQPAELAKVL
ncbi:MAG: bacillithiol system protein YtxJ [Glaciecola sp.]|jgi:bacillithiol system protein YtxJ